MPPLTRLPHRTLLPILLTAIAPVLIAQSTISAETSPPNQQAIADVQTGRTETAFASWWGFDPADATRSLQATLDSPAKRVIVDKMAGPWIVTTIRLPSNKEIVFESGVVVEARRGAFLGKSDCLFLANGSKNLILRGQGATLRMHKADYHKPPYEPAEWRHALSLRGCQDVTVEGLTLADSGGDGIYLGAGSPGATNRNITIRNVICDGHNRQGISVITAENLLIEDCVFSNTRGTAPEAGIDFEPNHPEERLVNCVLRNCRSENNAGHAYHLYLGQMHHESPPISIRFENCTSKGCERYSTYVGVANRNGEPTVRGSIEYIGCRFEADQGAAVYIRGNEADGCRVRFERCEIIRRDGPDSKIAPITIVAPQRLDLDAGNVEIVDCTIRDSLDRQPVALSASPMTGLRNVSGSLTVESPNGKTAYALDDEQLARWFPAQGLVARIPRLEFDWRKARPASVDASGPKDSATFRLRREAAMLVWGRADQLIELTVKMEPVGRFTPKPGPIDITSPGGKTTKLMPKAEEAQADYTFTPQETGPHRLHWQGAGGETLRPIRCTAAIAILGETLGANFIRPIGTLYFAVPAGVSRWAVVVGGAGTAETVKATVRNAKGDIVAEQDNIAAPHVFVLERDKTAVAEIWSLTLDKAAEGVMEDVSVQAVGIPPVFAATPVDLFVPTSDK
jgi:hypothetical protein